MADMEKEQRPSRRRRAPQSAYTIAHPDEEAALARALRESLAEADHIQHEEHARPVKRHASAAESDVRPTSSSATWHAGVSDSAFLTPSAITTTTTTTTTSSSTTTHGAQPMDTSSTPTPFTSAFHHVRHHHPPPSSHAANAAAFSAAEQGSSSMYGGLRGDGDGQESTSSSSPEPVARKKDVLRVHQPASQVVSFFTLPMEQQQLTWRSFIRKKSRKASERIPGSSDDSSSHGLEPSSSEETHATGVAEEERERGGAGSKAEVLSLLSSVSPHLSSLDESSQHSSAQHSPQPEMHAPGARSAFTTLKPTSSSAAVTTTTTTTTTTTASSPTKKPSAGKGKQQRQQQEEEEEGEDDDVMITSVQQKKQQPSPVSRTAASKVQQLSTDDVFAPGKAPAAAAASATASTISSTTSSPPAASVKNEEGASPTRKPKAEPVHKKVYAPRNPGHTDQSTFEIPEAPVFRPTAAEFEEPMQYIAKIRPLAQPYGICKIIPPKEWNPPFPLNKKEFKFSTRLQRIHQLFHRSTASAEFLAALRIHLQREDIELIPHPTLAGIEADLAYLSQLVKQHGGVEAVDEEKKWGKIAEELRIPQAPRLDERIQGCYYRYLLSFDCLKADEREKLMREGRAQLHDYMQEEHFGFDQGRTYTLDSFRRFADDFKAAWFVKYKNNPSRLRDQDLEKEYWDLLETSNRHVSVYYGSDIDTTVHGSGFPVDLSDPYAKFGWNLNVLPGLPESLLKHMSGISGISMPWLYVGMLFSTFCWHVEDNYLYSINYMHLGDCKRWYGVPDSHAAEFEAVFEKYLPDEFEKNPLILHDIVTMLSPKKLAMHGVKIVTSLQQAGEFIITFPQSYHGGFSQGFNVGEAVNFACADWLPFGLKATNTYRAQKRPSSLDLEQLVIDAARKETDLHTLQYVVETLRIIKTGEEMMRARLAALGVTRCMAWETLQQTAPGIVTALLECAKDEASAAPTGMGGRMEGGGGKMGPAHGHHMGSAASSSSMGGASASVGVTRMQRFHQGHGQVSCSNCDHICHISMAVALPTQPVTGGLPALCLLCAASSDKWRPEEMTIVQRYTPAQLQEVIEGVLPKIAHLPPLPAEEFEGLLDAYDE